jgi:shikimate dehydrogenase
VSLQFPPVQLFPDLKLDPAADNYAVFGNPVAHSKSPLIHRLFAQQTGQRLHYQAVLVPEGQFAAALDRFQALGGKGLNITLPFKGEAWTAATQRSARAERCGSVNTLWFDDAGRRCGETTDGLGLIRDLARLGMDVRGRRVLILGAGGAVRGVLADLLAQAPSRLVIANRTPGRAIELLRDLGAGDRAQGGGYEALTGMQFDLIINGTSMVLHGELPPLPAGALAAGGACYDMVYGDAPTVFCRWARDRHAAALISDGLGMLVEQAAESFRLWRGVRPETATVLAKLRSAAG